MNNQYNTASLTKCSACQNLVSRQAASCPKCGQPLQSSNYQQPQFQQNFPQPVQKKNGIGKVFGIGCLGIIAASVLMSVISMILLPKTNTQSQSQPPQSIETPQSKPNPIEQSTKVKDVSQTKKKAATEEPYSGVCLRKLNEEVPIFKSSKLPQSVKNLIFQRCIALQGNARQAAEEVADFLESEGL